MTYTRGEIALYLSLLVFAVYAGTLHHAFHFDDLLTVLRPSSIRAPFSMSLPQLSIRPILLFTFKLNYAFGGFDPFGYHVVNILLHLTNTMLVWWLLTLFGVNSTGALFGAAVFAVHPIQTQSVTYISCRSVLLATLFYLTAVISFIKRQYAVAWVAFMLGLMSKEILVSLPIILCCVHFLHSSPRISLTHWVNKYWRWPVAIIVSAVILLSYRYFVLGGFVPNGSTPYTSMQYLVTELNAIPLYYLSKLIFPWGLSVDPGVEVFMNLSDPMLYIVPVTLTLWILALFSIREKVSVNIMFGVIWFFVTILPESSFIPILDAVAEHRMYLPMVGVAFIVAGITERLKSHYILFAVIVILSFLSINRNRVWATEISLWTDAVEKAPNTIRPHNNLGDAYEKAGFPDKAEKEFLRCLELRPDYAIALTNMGNILGKRGDLDGAEKYFRQSLAIDERQPEAWYNMATVYVKRGSFILALPVYEKAIEYDPNFYEAYLNAGIAAVNVGQFDKAEGYLDYYIQHNPSNSMELKKWLATARESNGSND